MQKYFVVTDVHSYYDEMMKALEKAGYDKNNPEHIFVSCGDLFDRGSKSKECLDYVLSIPKSRRIFIKGNHEQNLIDLIKEHRRFDESDRHNGTFKTMRHLCGTKSTKYDNIVKGLKENVKLKRYLKELKDFYRTEHYIFVHGWYPWCVIEDEDGKEKIKIIENDKGRWWKARWMCGFSEWYRIKLIEQECPEIEFPNEPITVCGHWHTSYGHARYRNVGQEFPDKGQRWKGNCCFDPFFAKNLIALDACTALTHMCNCVVLEEPTGTVLYPKNNL